MANKTFLLAAWGGLLIVISASLSSTWLEANLQGSITAKVSAKGSELMPVLSTIMLVDLAAILSIGFAAALARKIISLFTLALSSIAIWLLIAFINNPLTALTNTTLMKKATGIADVDSQLSLVSSSSLSLFAYVCLASFLILFLVQLALLVVKAPVRASTSKYQRQKAKQGSDHPIDLWDSQE